jgi:hypothetical protein
LEDAGRTVVPITLEVIDKGPCIVVRGEMQIRNAGSVRQTQVWWVIRVRDVRCCRARIAFCAIS